MALISLGLQTIDIPYKWISFNPIIVSAYNTYILYARFQCSYPELLYSSIQYKLLGKIQGGLNAESLVLGNVEYSSENISIPLSIQRYWDKAAPITIQFRRFPVWENLSNLSDCKLELQIDLNNKF